MLAAWWIRVLAVAIFVPNLTVSIVNQDFAAIILSNFSRPVSSLFFTALEQEFGWSKGAAAGAQSHAGSKRNGGRR